MVQYHYSFNGRYVNGTSVSESVQFFAGQIHLYPEPLAPLPENRTNPVVGDPKPPTADDAMRRIPRGRERRSRQEGAKLVSVP
jgi:hypothetical protein